MFSLTNSRPKIKLRPPKILVYYSICLFTLFVVLLIAQLRALELGATRQDGPKTTAGSSHDGHLETKTKVNQVVVTSSRNNNDSTSPWPQVPSIIDAAQPSSSIDRDDRANTYLRDGSDPTNSPSTEATEQRAAVSEPAGSSERVSSDADDHAHQQPQSRLAELTAAGTAAGLLVHDMMAQANMLTPFPYDEPSQSLGRASNSEDDETLGAQMPYAQMGPYDEAMQQQALLAQQQQQPREDGEAEHARSPLGSMGSAPLQTRQMTRAVAGAPEPPSEDQMPDSIESLMGADGAADAASDGDDDASGSTASSSPSSGIDEAANVDDGGGDDGEQLSSGRLMPQQAVHQAQMVAASPVDTSSVDGDDDDENENDDGAQSNDAAATAALQQAGSQLYGRNDRGPAMLMGAPTNYVQRRRDSQGDESSFEEDPEMMASNFGGVGDEQEQSLVAPMRDSLVDLNAAAGHYYGKKKKKVKKVKKIIIKKKKKKKKKKVKKVKKIKIIKIKKKKKKYPKKKKHHHHHHHHGGGHGKYYMYAKVPKKKSWEFGFKKGNKKHWIERHEKGHKNKFKTKVKWYDKKSKGKGVHIWDYNHYDKKKKKHH